MQTPITSEMLAKRLMANPYPQQELLSEDQFRDFAKERGLILSSKDLELFEEQGLLYPIVRLKRAFTLFKKVSINENGAQKETLQPLSKTGIEQLSGDVQKRYDAIFDFTSTLGEYQKSGHLIFPSKNNFRPWVEYTEGYEITHISFYHPYQFLVLNFLRDKKSYVKEVRYIPKKQGGFYLDIQSKNVIEVIAKYNKFIHFLLAIQDIYLPSIAQNFRGNFTHAIEQSFNQWLVWKESLNLGELLEQSDFTVENVKLWREHFVGEARFIDPLVNWFVLVRHIKHSKRKSLRGSALLAQDYYDIIDLLGRFLFDFTGEKQLDADEVFYESWSKWKQEIYGQERLTYDNREVMKKVLTDFGINPQDKILLVVEGATEKAVIPLITEVLFGLSIEQIGVRIFSLDGVGDIAPKRSQKLLELLTSASYAIPYILLDNHNGVREILEKYERDHLIAKEHWKIWQTDFEQDNFSEEAVFEEVKKQAKRHNRELTVTLNDIKKIRDKIPQNTSPIYLTALIEKISNFKINKKELGEALAKLIINKIKAQNPREYVPSTPLEEQILKIGNLARSIK